MTAPESGVPAPESGVPAPESGVAAGLGGLLAYPGADFDARVAAACREVEAGVCGTTKASLAEFARLAQGLGAHGIEELYTRTFDMNPACSLEVGWHLYGERYERGAFLVAMRGHMRRLGLPEDHELPDHLSHALAVLSRMDEGEGRRFAAEAVAPALAKVLAGLKDETNPYRHLLSAIEAAVSARGASTRGLEAPTRGPAAAGA